MNSISVSALLVAILVCSSVEANRLGRIVNGDKASVYQFPWHVSIHNTKTTGLKTYCGGSLIGANYVLTAASCVKDAQSLQVDIGSIDFWKPYETQHTVQFLAHPEYNETSKLNNIAVVRLQKNVEFRTNIQAILLPRITDVNATYESLSSYLSGYGVTEQGSNYLSGELRFAQQTVISNEKCRPSFDPGFISDSVLCAVGINGKEQAKCYGDQGGALVSYLDGAWVQIGVSSAVNRLGCKSDVPAGYTKIAPYLEWINYLTQIPLRP